MDGSFLLEFLRSLLPLCMPNIFRNMATAYSLGSEIFDSAAKIWRGKTVEPSQQILEKIREPPLGLA